MSPRDNSQTATLLLAGGRIKPKHRASWNAYLPGGVDNRALAKVGDRPMVDWVIDAIRPAARGRLLIAGDVAIPPDAVAVDGGESLLDTLQNGVAALLPSEKRLLVVTADTPFLTPNALRDLLENAPDADFVYTIARAEDCEERFPGMRRTTLKIAEGTFTGGNVVLLNPAFLRERGDVVRAAYNRRKSPLALAGLLGPGTLARLAVSRIHPAALTIPYLEAMIGRILGGATARAYITPFPELAADIDRPEEIPLAERFLKRA